MNLIKNSTKLTVAFVMALAFVVVSAYALSPSYAGHWAQNEMDSWQQQDLLKGDDDGNLRPNDGITRVEFMALVNRMSGFTEKVDASELENFRDVTEDNWYYETVAIALKAGYITGVTEEMMDPNGLLTREQAMAIMARISEATGSEDGYKRASDADKVAVWARKVVSACIDNGYIAGSNGEIRPTSNIKRAEAIVMLDRKLTNTRTFGFAGIYNLNNQKIANINIVGSGVVLEDAKVEKDVVIKKAVKDAVLKGEFENITSEADSVALTLDGNAEKMTLNGDVQLTGKAKVKKIDVAKDVVLNGTTLKSGAKVENVKIDAKEGEENAAITSNGTTVAGGELAGKTTEVVETPSSSGRSGGSGSGYVQPAQTIFDQMAAKLADANTTRDYKFVICSKVEDDGVVTPSTTGVMIFEKGKNLATNLNSKQGAVYQILQDDAATINSRVNKLKDEKLANGNGKNFFTKERFEGVFKTQMDNMGWGGMYDLFEGTRPNQVPGPRVKFDANGDFDGVEVYLFEEMMTEMTDKIKAEPAKANVDLQKLAMFSQAIGLPERDFGLTLKLEGVPAGYAGEANYKTQNIAFLNKVKYLIESLGQPTEVAWNGIKTYTLSTGNVSRTMKISPVIADLKMPVAATADVQQLSMYTLDRYNNLRTHLINHAGAVEANLNGAGEDVYLSKVEANKAQFTDGELQLLKQMI